MGKPKLPDQPNDPRSQTAKFTDLARELECDEDEEAFKAKLRKIATVPRAPVPPATKD